MKIYLEAFTKTNFKEMLLKLYKLSLETWLVLAQILKGQQTHMTQFEGRNANTSHTLSCICAKSVISNMHKWDFD